MREWWWALCEDVRQFFFLRKERRRVRRWTKAYWSTPHVPGIPLAEAHEHSRDALMWGIIEMMRVPSPLISMLDSAAPAPYNVAGHEGDAPAR